MQTNRRVQNQIIALLLFGGCLGNLLSQVQAEDLFKAGIAYQTAQPYTPHSLFAVVRPKSIGDQVTININQSTSIAVQNNTTVNNTHTLTENSTTIMNGIISNLFNWKKNLLPNVNGLDNSNQVMVMANNLKTYTFSDVVTCQVVQVLPNGNLVVQGKKTVFGNQEQQDLYVTGIVNPYFLDSTNTINSNQVANMEMNMAAHGVLTRQNGDGLWGKYFQFLN
jgi:flagellar L-ring protein FlgH